MHPLHPGITSRLQQTPVMHNSLLIAVIFSLENRQQARIAEAGWSIFTKHPKTNSWNSACSVVHPRVKAIGLTRTKSRGPALWWASSPATPTTQKCKLEYVHLWVECLSLPLSSSIAERDQPIPVIPTPTQTPTVAKMLTRTLTVLAGVTEDIKLHIIADHLCSFYLYKPTNTSI